MRMFVRVLLIALVATAAFAILGPLAPTGSFIHDWAESFRQALDAWWGFPFGLPGT